MAGEAFWLPVATGGGGGTGSFQGCSLTKSADQTGVATATLTAVTFDGEDFDTDGFHDNATNNSRITIPTGLGGKYLFIGATAIAQPAAKVEMLVAFAVNGVENVRTRFRIWNSEVTVENPNLRTTAILNVVAGDYVQLLAYHEHGSNRSLQGAVSQFSCAYLGA